jgi:sulfonate transport system permease protein
MAKVEAAPIEERRLLGGITSRAGSWSPRVRFWQVLRSDWTVRIVTLAVFLGAWEIFGRRTSTVTFASASRTWAAFREMSADGTLWDAWRADFLVMVTALAIATAAGLVLGFAFGRYRLADLFFEPVFNGIFMIPKIALLPIIALWLGFQFQAKVLVVILFCFFEIFFTVRSGVQATDAQYIDVAKAYMIPESMMLRKIVVPATIPYIITALRLGLLHGLVGVVLAGFFLENIGIGGLISNETGEFKMDTTFAAMITVMFVGISINLGLRWLERRISPWTQLGQLA